MATVYIVSNRGNCEGIFLKLIIDIQGDIEKQCSVLSSGIGKEGNCPYTSSECYFAKSDPDETCKFCSNQFCAELAIISRPKSWVSVPHN